MPPRKKPRLSTSRDSSIPGTSPAATPISLSALSPAAPSNADPTSTSTSYWPLAAQTALFKALIASKPTGPHKHFHLLTIAHALSSDLGYYIPVSQIREKLSELYDIEQLDRREQEYAFRVRDKRGDWMPEVYKSVFVLPGEPRVHGSRDVDMGGEEGDGVDREAIKELFGAKDADEAFFVDAVWRRRFPDLPEEENGGDDAAEEASPAPSTLAGGSRRGRQTRGTRLSEIKAEDEGDEDAEDDEEDPEGTPDAQKSTRTSARTRRSKKR